MGRGKSDSRLQDIGCAGRVTTFAETDDGRYLITMTGISRFRVRKLETGFTPYSNACVDWSDFEKDLGPADDDPDFDRKDFFGALSQYFEMKGIQVIGKRSKGPNRRC